MARDSGRSRSDSRATARLEAITSALEQAFGVPSRRRGTDLLGGLVGTILSQNTTDTNSSRAYATLRERFPEWEAVEHARVRSIESAIRVGGLAHTKAKRIKKILREIRRERGALDLAFLKGMSDEDVMAYLTSLDGVGVKTAACVALFHLRRDVMCVDTHVHRVVGRLGVVGRPNSREKTYESLRGAVPKGRSYSLHINLVRLGRSLCRPRRPDCLSCPVRRHCSYGSAAGAASTASAASC